MHIEAATLEAAREQARLQMPPGFDLHSEAIEQPGRLTRLRFTAKTTEATLEQPRKAVPKGGTVVAEDVILGSTFILLLSGIFGM